ncbi:sensor histidine kinase [Aquimarina algiphila]|uniref:sensor histidine kinase n=1 Tax=Aquimarina algiphila TaxID=2047982 RepID=UPI00232E5601|nr:sensor histidine kinase [Aquimarina algiphila]
MNNIRFTKSDYKFIVIYFIGATVWLLYRWNVENYSFFEIWTGWIGMIVKNLALIFVFKWLINEFLIIKKSYIIFILLGFFLIEVIGFIDMLRDYYTSTPRWKMPSFDIMLIQNFRRSADGFFLMSFVFGKNYYDNKIDNIELKNTQKELELKLLRSQFNPHFLYNSLNTIDALVDYSPKEKVKEYISNLASLYRYLIKTHEEDIVTLEDEILLIKNYIYLIETRFENDYRFNIIEESIVKDRYLPSGVLLTALENVVKHNQPQINAPIITTILIENKTVKITNTIAKSREVNESFGTGLKSLKKRYELLSDKMIDIKQSEKVFILKLPLLTIVD